MKPFTALIAGVIVLGIGALGALRAFVFEPNGDTVTVVHWTTGHLLQEEAPDLHLLDDMANDFNKSGHRTRDGKRIEVKVYYASGAKQWPDLNSRIAKGVSINRELPDPTMVTPSASHWLINVNAAVGREVFDLRDTERFSIARAYVGIVTYREIAECLGWPNKAIGYADMVALRANPQGWQGYTCANGSSPLAQWGDRPLLAFTDPTSSDSGRAVLFMLYAMAAGKSPADLTEDDLTRPEVVSFVKDFQQLVDHYQPETADVNSKVYQGPEYGHFFLMPEDNLIHLYAGTEQAYIDGVETTAPPLRETGHEAVMIYPKEGALLRENCACIVDASWVSAEQREAAELWRAYLREDAQQQNFMKAGFRPGTELAVGSAVGPANGLNPAAPATVLHMEQINPRVAIRIDELWAEVKRPGVVVFVVDTSASMTGNKLKQAKEGLVDSFDAMAQNNSVGLIAFSDSVAELKQPIPLKNGKFALASDVKALKADGGTALYDAVSAGVSMADSASGAPGAIRAVVVLTDGKANQGSQRLDGLVSMTSTSEVPICIFGGMENEFNAKDCRGAAVPKANVIGTDLKFNTAHQVQVFFIGVGDADLEIGRIIAEATGAEFRGVTEEDLANVLAVFGKYF